MKQKTWGKTIFVKKWGQFENQKDRNSTRPCLLNMSYVARVGVVLSLSISAF
jgi:hypothetical protein